MNVRKLIQERIRHSSDGVNVVGDVNAAIAANVNEPGPTHTHVSTRQRVVQRSGSGQAPKRQAGKNHEARQKEAP